MTGLAEFGEMNEVYEGYFKTHPWELGVSRGYSTTRIGSRIEKHS